MSAIQEGEEGMVVIVANRGPHVFVWEEGRWVARAATGGLVSMIEPLARQPNVAWFCCVSEPPGSEGERPALFTTAKDQTDPDLNVVPVPLPADVYQDYYGAISNEVLWMLQHHLVGQFGYADLDAARHRAWQSYLEANERMADAIAATELPVRAFLIQDYHLYPLPELLRQRFPNTSILHFTHIPFPDPSLLKLLPKAWREAILRGLLGADIVAFQTAADVRSFLASCEELLGAGVDLLRRTVVLRNGRTVRVRAFAASADPEAVRALQAGAEVAEARERLRPLTAGSTIVRIDRLDPSKNQILGFAAFGRLLELHPELLGRVRFLAFLIPSRSDLTVYSEYHDAVYRTIAAINARFGPACGFDPIEVFYTNDRAQAFAAMEFCDVLLVNSRQDGMNLVVKEWALVSEKPGVLVISETAGVAAETYENALPVCPMDIEGTAQALAQALAMPLAERAAWVRALRESICRWTARDWLEAQLKELRLPLPKRVVAAALGPPARGGAGGPLERTLTVGNREGIHARPAAAFVRRAREFQSEIEIVRGDVRFSAKSILAVLTANLNFGVEFVLRAQGGDAEEALAVLEGLLERLAAQEAEEAVAK